MCVAPIIIITQRNRNALADISRGSTLSVCNLRPTGVFVLITLDLPQLFICKDRHYWREKNSCVLWVDVHGQ